jgi:hypothetical protein
VHYKLKKTLLEGSTFVPSVNDAGPADVGSLKFVRIKFRAVTASCRRVPNRSLSRYRAKNTQPVTPEPRSAQADPRFALDFTAPSAPPREAQFAIDLRGF